MGYPMTWKRLVHRNNLLIGDYTDAGAWDARVNTSREEEERADLGGELLIQVLRNLARFRRERIEEYQRAAMMLLGDIRRLEADALDEKSVCAYISSRTGVESDVVAAVLKEFFSQ